MLKFEFLKWRITNICKIWKSKKTIKIKHSYTLHFLFIIRYQLIFNFHRISNHWKRPQSIPPNNAYSSKFIPQSYSNSPSKSAKSLLTSPNPFNTYTHLSMLHPPTKSISTLISDSDNLQTTLNQHLLPTFHTLRSQISSKHSGMQFLEQNYQTHLNSLYSNLKSNSHFLIHLDLNKAIQYSQIEHHKNTKEINDTIDRLKEVWSS